MTSKFLSTLKVTKPCFTVTKMLLCHLLILTLARLNMLLATAMYVRDLINGNNTCRCSPFACFQKVTWHTWPIPYLSQHPSTTPYKINQTQQCLWHPVIAIYFTFLSSTSKTSVELGGITGGDPLAPYLKINKYCFNHDGIVYQCHLVTRNHKEGIINLTTNPEQNVQYVHFYRHQ